MNMANHTRQPLGPVLVGLPGPDLDDGSRSGSAIRPWAASCSSAGTSRILRGWTA